MRTFIAIPDTHAPYHDECAFNLMLQVANHIQPDVVLILGDFADMYSVSDHEKDPGRALRLVEEIQSVRRELEKVASIKGVKERHFVEGNHEFRLTRFLRNTTVLHDLPGLSFPAVANLSSLGFQFHPYGQHMRLGDLYVTHDADYSGKYAIHHTGAAFEASVLFGHTHRMGTHYFGTAAGASHVAASVGWLGSAPKADYLKVVKKAREWQLGFGVGEILSDGRAFITPVPIVGGACVVGGRVFGAGEQKQQTVAGRNPNAKRPWLTNPGEVTLESVGNCWVCEADSVAKASRGGMTVRLCETHRKKYQKMSVRERDSFIQRVSESHSGHR